MVSCTGSVAHLNRLLDRIASLVLDAPMRIAALIGIILLLAGYGAAQLQFDDGIRSTFASSNPHYTRYSTHLDRYAQSDTGVVLLIGAGERFEPAQLTHLRDGVAAMTNVDGVEAVFSIFGVNLLNPDAGDIGGFDAAALAMLPSVQPQSERTAAPTASQSLISADGTETVMIVALRDGMQDLATARPTLADIRAIANELRDGNLTVEISGMIPIRERIIDGITRDQMILNTAGALLGFLISLLLFRSLWIAALNGIAPICALALSLGAFGLLGFEINTVRNALPVLILVLATADCIHMTHDLTRRTAESGELAPAIRSMLTDIGPPCVLTSLTTMLAFASLYYSESPLIQSLSLSGVLAVGIALFAILVIHPLVFVITWHVPPIRRTLCRPRAGLPNSFELGGLTKKALRARLAAMLGGGALAIGLLLIFLPLETDFRFYEFIEEHDPMIETLHRAEAIAGPFQSIDLPLSLSDPDATLDNAAMDDLARVHQALEQAMPDHRIVSAESLSRALVERGEFPGWNSVELALVPLPDIVSDSLVARDDSGLLLRVMTADMASRDIRTLADQVERIADTVPLANTEARAATGLPVVAARLSDTMIRQLTISFLIAAFACPLLMGLWFRRWDYALVAILPNMLPILAVGAWLSWMGWNLQFTSALALSIAFGIAVDDTIHVLNRHALERSAQPGRASPAIIGEAMRRVTPALIATTLILSAGVIATLLSGMPTMRYFGALCVAIFLLALIADLILLPAFLAWRAGRRT